MSRDPHTGTVRAAAKLDGALTAPSGRDAEAVALDYVRTHARALGLDATAQPPGLERARRIVDGRLQLITWGQRYRGIPSADTYLKAAIDDRGRLLSLTGAPAAELAPPTVEPALTAAEAVAAVTGAAPRQARAAGGAERATAFRGGARASLVLYQGEGGTRLAWRVIAPISGAELADPLINAADGTMIKRANRMKFATRRSSSRTRRTPSPGGHRPARSGWGTGDRDRATRVHAFPDPNDVMDFELDPNPRRDGQLGGRRCCAPTIQVAITRCTWTATRAGTTRTRARPALLPREHVLDHLADAPIGFGDASGGSGAAAGSSPSPWTRR